MDLSRLRTLQVQVFKCFSSQERSHRMGLNQIGRWARKKRCMLRTHRSTWSPTTIQTVVYSNLAQTSTTNSSAREYLLMRAAIVSLARLANLSKLAVSVVLANKVTIQIESMSSMLKPQRLWVSKQQGLILLPHRAHIMSWQTRWKLRSKSSASKVLGSFQPIYRAYSALTSPKQKNRKRKRNI